MCFVESTVSMMLRWVLFGIAFEIDSQFDKHPSRGNEISPKSKKATEPKFCGFLKLLCSLAEKQKYYSSAPALAAPFLIFTVTSEPSCWPWFGMLTPSGNFRSVT